MWVDSLSIFAELGVDDILNNGATTARSITDSWDRQWVDLLQNNTKENLYGALTNLGVFFAVGTLLFFMIRWLRDMIESESSRPLSELIWPFIVVALLANPGNGTTLSNLTLGVRNYINHVNQQVVTASDVNQNYQQALNMSVAEEVAGSFLRPCEALTGNQQTDCLIKAAEKTDQIWKGYRNLYGNKVWIDRLEAKVNQITNNNGVINSVPCKIVETTDLSLRAKEECERSQNGSVSEIAFDSLLGSTIQTSIKNFLISLQFAFLNLTEATMLLIAVLGPLAVGGSLLPVAGKPIFAWLTGFLSIGIAKISFNIIAVLTSTVVVNIPTQNTNDYPDLMWFIIFLGILAPILSLGLAAAGGFAVFNAISNTTSWVRERV